MADVIPVLEEEDYRPVPTVWRQTLGAIVEAFKEGDFALARNIPGVRPLSGQEAAGVANALEDCNVQLGDLPPETWQSSVCLWTGRHWDVMVDLYKADGQRSDLLLDMMVHEAGALYVFEFHLVYVP